MKINKLKINAFGKLKEREIELSNGINIIYGENESGKSTLLKFILNSFYGSSKNKKGREISDYEQYKPWAGEDFSGKLSYTLDNNNTYEIYREFSKKNPKIYNENSEEISKEYMIDKTKGSQFFYEQTKIDEELFLSSFVTLQQETKIEKGMQNYLIQKMSNMIGTGEDTVSYKRAIEKLNKKQLNEVGTEKSREKPINQIENKMEILQEEEKKLEYVVNVKYENEAKKEVLEKKINEQEIKKKIMSDIKRIKETEKIENEKINIQKSILEKNLNKLKEVENKINNIKDNNKNLFEESLNSASSKKSKRKNKETRQIDKKILLVLLIIIVLNILSFVFIKNKIFNCIFILTVPTFLVFSVFLKINKNKVEKNKLEEEENKNKKIEDEINYLINEKEIIEKNNNEIKKEIEKNISENILKNNLEKEKVKNKYKKEIEENQIRNLINKKEVEDEIEKLEKEIQEKRNLYQKIEFEQKDIEKRIEHYVNIKEELGYLQQQYINLKKINESINLTKEILEKSYEKMKSNVTPKFTSDLSAIINHITNGKYNKVIFNDETGLMLELNNGDYISVNRLSVGTIDQLYLALRFSILDELTREKLPIILDETFAYYDNNRLENILTYLKNNFKDRQVIIFTCTNREKELLEKQNIEYKYISL